MTNKIIKTGFNTHSNRVWLVEMKGICKPQHDYIVLVPDQKFSFITSRKQRAYDAFEVELAL